MSAISDGVHTVYVRWCGATRREHQQIMLFFERLSANYATRCPIFDRIQLLWTVVVTSAVLLSQQCCHPHPVQQNNTLQYTTTVRYVLCASRSPFPSTPIQKRKSVPNVRVDRQQLVAYGKVFTVVFQSVCTLRPLHLPQKRNILAWSARFSPLCSFLPHSSSFIHILNTNCHLFYSSSSFPFLPPLSPSLLICSGVVGPPPSLLRCVRRPVAEARCSASTDTADLGGGYCCGGGAGPGGAREASFGGGAPGSGRSIGWEGAGELRRARQQLGGKRWRIWIRGRGAAPATTPSPARRHLETWRPLLSRCCCSSRAGCSPRRPWICDEDLPWRSRRLELGGGSDSGSCSSSSVEVTSDDHDGGVPGAPCALWAPRWGAAARTTTPPFSTRAGATASSTATTLLLDAGAVGGVSSSPPPPSCYRCATTTNGVGPAPRPFAEARYPATFPGNGKLAQRSAALFSFAYSLRFGK
jgi:hypothetical protein